MPICRVRTFLAVIPIISQCGPQKGENSMVRILGLAIKIAGRGLDFCAEIWYLTHLHALTVNKPAAYRTSFVREIHEFQEAEEER